MPSQERPHDIYARLLIPRDSTRGYPLWYPEPDDNLPEPCRDEGLRIGDVGIVTERGTFDILFNICLPQEHPVNQWGGVPATFKQVQLSARDISRIGNADNAGRVISTKSIRERNLTARVAAGGNSTVTPARLGLNLNFTSTSAEGAILVLPEGAGTEDLLKLGPFEDQARENGESWYRYACVDQGRTSINNDSLYLITGYHKASSWAVAAFSDASGSAGLNATFTAGQVAEGNVAAAYSWQVTNSMHWRVGPVERHSDNSRNQAVFIRGFKIALREGVFALLRGPVKVSPIVPATKFSTSRAYLPRTISPGNRAQGHRESQRQSPGGESSLEKGPASNSCGTSKGLDVECLGWGPEQGRVHDQRVVEANAREFGMHPTPARMYHYDDSESETSDDSEADDLVDSSNISIQLLPSPSKVYHPSDVINRFLLDSEPLANIAVTHDNQWMSMLHEDLQQVQEDELIKHIRHRFRVEYNSTSTGSVYLREHASQDFQSPKDDDRGSIGGDSDVLVPSTPASSDYHSACDRIGPLPIVWRPQADHAHRMHPSQRTVASPASSLAESISDDSYPDSDVEEMTPMMNEFRVRSPGSPNLLTNHTYAAQALQPFVTNFQPSDTLLHPVDDAEGRHSLRSLLVPDEDSEVPYPPSSPSSPSSPNCFRGAMMQDHDTGRHGIERAVGSGGFRTQVVSSPQSSTLSSSLEIPLRSGLSIPRPSTSMQQKKSKMHKCQKCDKMFPRISALATHMNTHSGAKPYERTVSGCDTRFAPRANARRHLRTHGIDPSSFDNAPSGPAFMAGFDEPLTTQVHDTGKQPSRYRWIPQTLSSRPTDRLSPGSSSTVAEVPLRARHISSYPVASSVVSGPSQTAQMTTTSPQLPYSPLSSKAITRP